jgi:response regulator of citrate/malate metabolism
MLDAVKGLLSVGGGPSMKSEFRGQFKIEYPVSETTLPKEIDAKKTIIDQIKRRGMGRFADKISVKQEQEKQQKDVAEGKVVETTIDKLFNLVDKRDKVKINDALAKELGISKERIEEWAVILEEHNLVSINYPTIGEPDITRKHKK